MKSKTLVTAGLISGFLANAAFAETGLTQPSQNNDLTSRIAQVQKNGVYAKSVSLDAILNSKPELAKSATGSPVVPITRKTNLPEKPRKPATKQDKPDIPGRPKTVRERFDELRRLGNFNPARATGKNAKILPKKSPKYFDPIQLSKRDAKIYEVIMNARNLEQLSPRDRAKLVRLHRKMLKTEIVQVMLDTIQKGEGGGPLVIVGKGKGKSQKFKRKMNELDFSTHPFYQFPKGSRCFYFNSQVGKCSTASGNYQITVTNFDYYRRQLGLTDFSVETQQIIAMELIRTARARTVPGNYKGRGYIELLKGNINKAIRYGTNDWASSPYSEWQGAKTPYQKDAEMIAKNRKLRKSEKLKDASYFQKWIDEADAEAE